MTMTPTALFPNPFPESLYSTAYDKCLNLQNDSEVQAIPDHPSPLVSARLLGHMLRLAPNDQIQGQLQREICDAKDDRTLIVMALFYVNNFIRGFKRKGATPAPTENPSRSSLEEASKSAPTRTKQGTLDHRTARKMALYRDDHRCLITGKKDYKEPDGDLTTIVQTAHIIPESALNTNIDVQDNKRYHSSSLWAILGKFTTEKTIDDLTGNKIHNLENILSLNVNLHTLFDDLYLWLKPIQVGENVQNAYRVCSAKNLHGSQLPEFVTFHTPTEFPLPKREYLALHALCCEVAWLSGAAEYVMDMERRMDNTKVLAEDGSNAGLLKAALEIQVY